MTVVEATPFDIPTEVSPPEVPGLDIEEVTVEPVAGFPMDKLSLPGKMG